MKSLIIATMSSNTGSLTARFISSCSAPNISGTSVSSTLPPSDVMRSAMRPSSALALMPLKPSEPPHLWPSTRSDTGHSVRRSPAMRSIKLRDGARSFLELVDHVLRVEERDAIAIDRTGEAHQLVELIVLAAESEDQHAAGVRMAQQTGEHGLSVL